MKLTTVVFLLASSLLAKDKALVPCVRKVFLTGNQTYALAWAKKNLGIRTCMIPVSTLEEADAILDLEPDQEVVAMRARALAGPAPSTSYSVSCFSSPGHTNCIDSDHNVLSTDCAFRGTEVTCSTYSGGVPQISTVARIGYLVMDHIFLRNTAHAFLFDKQGKQLWKFTGLKPWERAIAQEMGCVRGAAKGSFPKADPPVNKVGKHGQCDICQ